MELQKGLLCGIFCVVRVEKHGICDLKDEARLTLDERRKPRVWEVRQARALSSDGLSKDFQVRLVCQLRRRADMGCSDFFLRSKKKPALDARANEVLRVDADWS